MVISSPGDLPHPGVEPGSPAWRADALLSELPGKKDGSSKDAHVLIPSTCHYATLHDKRDLGDVIKNLETGLCF